MKILLIDDSQMVLRHIHQLLAGLAPSVRGAENIAEGVRFFEFERPDVVLVDYILGNKQTGLQAIELLKDLEKKNSVLVNSNRRWAILTHAALDETDAERAKQLGVPVIAKPTHGKEEDFLDSIRSLMAGEV